jgi:hypothetical protein
MSGDDGKTERLHSLDAWMMLLGLALHAAWLMQPE